MKQYSRADFLKAVAGAPPAAGGMTANQSPKNQFANKTLPQSRSSSLGINPYTGAWGPTQIMHLLRRSLFGLTQADYNHFSGMTLNQCLDELFTQSPAASPPVNTYNSASYTDPNVPAGQTWINSPLGDGTGNNLRIYNLKAWWVGLMLNQDRSLTEKMTLFLHNHFATQMQIVKDARYSYKHIALLRSYALGNFKNLTRAVTTDPNMLVYLNGDTNTAGAPNENYGRELQELFTVGKGPDSLYTEADVQAAARVLTGWKDSSTNISSSFSPSKHDTTNKQFSAFYNGTVITGQTGTNGAHETDALIDMIFSQREAAKYLCRNLYRWFIYYVIDSTVEDNVISPLADVVISNNFELAPVLRTLLGSEHFFDPINVGCHIKNPVDHLVGVCRQFNVVLPAGSDETDQYKAWQLIEGVMATMSMDLGDPPNVAGWPAYYVDPEYNEIWINSSTLPLRNQMTDAMSATGGYTYHGINFAFDLLSFTAQLSNPSDPDQLITDSIALLSPNAFDSDETAFVKSILLSGQTADYYWSDAWNAYAADPTNAANKSVVQTRLTQYYAYIMERAEYQLI